MNNGIKIIVFMQIVLIAWKLFDPSIEWTTALLPIFAVGIPAGIGGIVYLLYIAITRRTDMAPEREHSRRRHAR